MKFIENLSKEEYITFCNNFKPNHFMQSYEWGEVCLKNRDQVPYYVGITSEQNELIAVALILKKKTPLNMSYLYSSRGPLLDYNNKDLLSFFTNSIKEFAKKHNAIYFKMDPAWIYQKLNKDGSLIEGEKNNQALIDYLKSLGFLHGGFNKLFEKNQPRYTFRINLESKTWEELQENMSKKFYKKAYGNTSLYGIEIVESNDVKTFHELLKSTSVDNKFSENGLNYYQNIYDEFIKTNQVIILSAVLTPKKAIENLETELNNTKISLVERRERLTKDLEYFRSIQTEIPTSKIVAAFFIIMTNQGGWQAYAGSDHYAEKTSASKLIYCEAVKWAFNKGLNFYDLFGTVGDPKTTYKNLAGIHECKQSMGGDYLEFIGEFDLILKPFWNKILPVLLKIYRALKKLLKK